MSEPAPNIYDVYNVIVVGMGRPGRPSRDGPRGRVEGSRR